MNKKDTKSIISGMGWSFGERVLAQGVTFIVSIIIARVLSPNEYGIISLLLIFINLANVFVTNGFGEALIQKKHVTEKDYSTIFWCAFSFSLILYFLVFIFSHILGKMYDEYDIVPILRVLGLVIPLSSFNTVQHAYVSKHMEFKRFFFSTLGGTVISGIIGIILAYSGVGIWALVSQYLLNTLIDTIVLLLTVEWHPRFLFDKESAKIMIKYGWKVTGASFLNEFYIQLRSLIIGKIYSVENLAYYNKGDQFPSVLVSNINAAINRVFFPVMSSLQDNKHRLKEFSKKSLLVTSYMIFPVLCGLMGVAENLIVALLTDKWKLVVPYIRILSIYYMTQPLQIINWQILKAAGRSDICLKLEILKKIIGFFLIFSTMYISVYALAWSTTVFAIISMIINMLPNKKIIEYSIKEQVKDVLPNLCLAACMGFSVWRLDYIIVLPAWLMLVIQILFGICFYVIFSFVFKMRAVTMLRDVIDEFVKIKKK